jgi:hypothetical protein
MCIHELHFHQACNGYFEKLKFVRVLCATTCLFALLLYIWLIIAIIICCDQQSFVDCNINMYRISRDKAVMSSQGSGWHVAVCLIIIVGFHYQLLLFSYSGFILRNTSRWTVSDFQFNKKEGTYLLPYFSRHTSHAQDPDSVLWQSV